MPRAPRAEQEGGVFHVFARGVARRPIFFDDADRRAYLGLLGRTIVRQRWRCLAYCLMGNHVHLLLETPQPNLGRGMQRLHGFYAQGFNARHGLSGHVFESRYGAVAMKDDGQIRTVVSYIARNPVTAGRCTRPEAWPWSSHGVLAAGRVPPWLDHARALTYFDAIGGAPARRYAEAVAARADGDDLSGPRPVRSRECRATS